MARISRIYNKPYVTHLHYISRLLASLLSLKSKKSQKSKQVISIAHLKAIELRQSTVQ